MSLAAALVERDLLEEVHALGPDEVVRELTKAIGRSAVALVAGVKETKLVAKWEKGDVVPQMSRELTLKTALQIVRILQPRYQKGTIVSWLSGMNPRLSDDAPVEVLARLSRDYKPDEARNVLNAAKAFSNR